MKNKLFILIKIAVLVNLFISLINKEWTAIFICLFNFILLYLVDYLQKKFDYNNLFKLLIYIFLVSSLIGGEIYFLYSKIWFYDIILHIFSSFIVSGFFLYIFKLFKCNINKLLFMLCIFSFAMMIASLWEIAEFSIDRLFDVDMQKDTVINEVNSMLLSDNGNIVVKNKISSMTIGKYIVNGYLDIGLYDTINDMVCAIIGSLIFIIYIFYKEKKLL